MTISGRLAVALAGIALSSLCWSGLAQAADPVTGKRLATKWCSACHVVSREQAVASDASLPSFYDMAADETLSERSLKTFLADPHPKMPNMSLSNSEIADLARYILSLKS